MFVAQDELGALVDAEYADRSKKYYCTCCGNEVTLKAGSIKVKHFAHKSVEECETFTSDMSEWHKEWQSKFPLRNREVVIECNGIKHRADVLAYGYVIEFQNSPISREEFNLRNRFYTTAGYKVIWIFNLIDEWDYGQIYLNPNSSGRKADFSFVWLYARKCFADFDHKDSKVKLFFQFEKSDFEHEEYCYLHGVSWVPRECGKSKFKYFITNPKRTGGLCDLMEWISRRIL